MDVGYNKAFKSKVKDQYLGWLFNQDPDMLIAKTMRCHVVDWSLAAKQNITTQVIHNAWRKTGYSYFSD